MEPIYSGKVREIYDISEDKLVIVTTDRISAFDNILPITIKDKGIVLNTLSNFWFNKTRSIVLNHILEEDVCNMPPFFRREYFRGRTVMVKKLKMLPFEFIVRGYMFGSMWEAYQRSGEFCGAKLKRGCAQAQRLPEAILTPAIKRDGGHDEYISMSELKKQLGASLAEHIEKICMELYKVCIRYALSRGLIIADAKFEFGMDEHGHAVLADEIFTPDSSRFWELSDYRVGSSPKSYDKQLLRDWLLNNRKNGKMQFDKIPPFVISQTEQIYRSCLSRLT